MSSVCNEICIGSFIVQDEMCTYMT